MIDQIIEKYTSVVQGIQKQTEINEGRATGGVQRSEKGRLVEEISRLIIRQAWEQAGGDSCRLKFDDKTYKIYLQEENIFMLPEFIQKEFASNKESIFYRVQVDTHVFIDNQFVMGIECKAYTENAMLKRILIDMYLLKTLYPDLICCLLQVETFLGGENTEPSLKSPIANHSTYTLMSFFPDVNLQIMTLLEGARDIGRPIHQPGFFKEMKPVYVRHTIDRFSELLVPFV